MAICNKTSISPDLRIKTEKATQKSLRVAQMRAVAATIAKPQKPSARPSCVVSFLVREGRASAFAQSEIPVNYFATAPTLYVYGAVSIGPKLLTVFDAKHAGVRVMLIGVKPA